MNHTLSNVKKNRKKEEIVFYKCETKKENQIILFETE